MPDDRYEAGMKVRRTIHGDEYVDRSIANRTEFDADFQRFITETAWGSIWVRPGLDHRTRHLLTVAILAALGKEHELGLYIRATRNTGVTQDEIKEVLLHISIYAGIPAANTAFAIAKRVYAELDNENPKE
jgi:4-carboxymuconolactone decarboxylase